MTGAQKKQIAYFLDITGDYLRDGYARPREYRFSDDPPAVFSSAGAAVSSSAAGGFPAGSGGFPAGSGGFPSVAAVSPARAGGFPSVADVGGESLRGAGRGGGGSADAAAAGAGEAQDSLERIAAEVSACRLCGLHTPKTLPIPGDGVKRPLVLAVGGAPLGEENALGQAFSGGAGGFFDRMLASVNLSRNRNCFLTHAVKCCPIPNRAPLPNEISACAGFLARQVARLKPALILCLGQTAAQTLLNTSEPLDELRGKFAVCAGVPLLPTYHPGAILRDGTLKRPAWEDLKALRTRLISLDERYALEIREGG